MRSRMFGRSRSAAANALAMRRRGSWLSSKPSRCSLAGGDGGVGGGASPTVKLRAGASALREDLTPSTVDKQRSSILAPEFERALLAPVGAYPFQCTRNTLSVQLPTRVPTASSAMRRAVARVSIQWHTDEMCRCVAEASEK